jgi:hypothetical protein
LAALVEDASSGRNFKTTFMTHMRQKNITFFPDQRRALEIGLDFERHLFMLPRNEYLSKVHRQPAREFVLSGCVSACR